MARRVLITGSTRGIRLCGGVSVCRAGHQVLIDGLSRRCRRNYCREFLGRQALAVAVIPPDRAAIARIVAEAGDVDVLVNCAGVYEDMPMAAVEEADGTWMIAGQHDSSLASGARPSLRLRGARKA